MEHITITPYHPRSNSQAERFMDTFKRVLKKSNSGSMEVALQQFLSVYRLMPNKNAPSAMTPAEIIFVQKIRSVFNKLIPIRKKSNIRYKKLEINFTKWVKMFFTECIRWGKDIGKLKLSSKESVG